ncbi:MAG: hypothetical protein M1825_002403 [Sarcosagium campestre]|nr:MAG: hypothetical protein M1825_002403 [Sarcosagium campestre]
MVGNEEGQRQASAFDSPTFTLDISIRVDQPVGSMSISPCGRDVVLASRLGLHVIDLDSPYSPPRHLPHATPWEVADVQWSPFPARDYWIVSTSNQKALVWNLAMKTSQDSIEHVLHAHTRAITDINFSAHHPDKLATCAVDSFVHCWDLRAPEVPVMTFCDWFAGATQVKWNRQDQHIIASSHDKYLRIWDDRKGAYPLRTIDAHDTKIYGVDWNRTDAKSIVTCSLDRSIKFWDYDNLEDKPRRVIRTPFPVWRARHTPCGEGMLAMPQRENSDVHLYDRRLTEGMSLDEAISPVHTFDGHRDRVKEFLWRPRGGIDHDVDNREFQLVTWGADKDLRLHRIDDAVLKEIGYEKGHTAAKGFNFTRRNAAYRSFCEEPSRANPQYGKTAASTHALSRALKGALSAGMRKAPIPLSSGWGDSAVMSSQRGIQAKRDGKMEVNSIDWMKGVKIGKKQGGQDPNDANVANGTNPSVMSPTLRASGVWEPPESLGEEMTHVADRFAKVAFERVEVQKREATIAVNGPWGHGGSIVYVKMETSFPTKYPESEPPVFRLERTSSIPDETLDKVVDALNTIAGRYVTKGRGCLEAVICYLLGERGIEESTPWPFDQTEAVASDDVEAAMSSDDEEDEGADVAENGTQFLEASGADLGPVTSNSNVPLPKSCGAAFTPDGRLVCFFPRKTSVRDAVTGAWASRGKEDVFPSKRAFERFGRLQTGSMNRALKINSIHEESEEGYDSAEGSAESSSDSSSSSGEEDSPSDIYGLPNWRRTNKASIFSQTRSTDYSQRSIGAESVSVKGNRRSSINVVSIHDLGSLLPCKRVLADEYAVFGDGPGVCRHNAEVAEKHGFQDLADVWNLARLILYNRIPLEVMEQHYRREPILVVARKAARSTARRDSGLDLAFDEADVEGTKPVDLLGRVKWGSHPLGGAWIVDTLFQHFEKLADVQMLAMLSCVFSEPAVRGATSNTSVDLSHRDLPMSMKSPAFSLDYFPSAQVAWSLYQPTFSIPATPKMSMTPLGTFGSAGSSNGQWGSDPITPYSTGTTPPLRYKLSRWSGEQADGHSRSFSTSPEHHQGRRSNASLTSTFAASLSRGFSNVASSSPPAAMAKRRPSPVDSALGNMTTGGVTWGANTVFGAAAAPKGYGYGPSTSVVVTESDTEEDEAVGTAAAGVRVTMKNQNMFDTEGHASVPLLDTRRSYLYKGYRESYADMLGVWGLWISRLEILKFNGLRSYFPDVHPGGSFISLGKKQAEATASARTGLDVAGHCRSCGTRLRGKPMSGTRGRCEKCARTQEKMACSICREVLQGSYMPCLQCGHVLHPHCHGEWFEVDGQRECPTGCGCLCQSAALDTVTVEVDDPAAEAEKKPLLQLQPQSPLEETKPDLEVQWDGWEEVGMSGLGRGLGGGLSRGLVPGRAEDHRL